MHEITKGYQAKNNFIKGTKCDMCADSIAI
jgi:hypothetical protein